MEILLSITFYGIIKFFLLILGIFSLLCIGILIFIILHPMKEYHYEDLESETWLDDNSY